MNKGTNKKDEEAAGSDYLYLQEDWIDEGARPAVID